LQIAKQIIGEEAHFIQDLAIVKRAKSGAATPRHQDVAFRDPHFCYQEITIWITLQNVSESSGCLMFVPKSDLGAIREHISGNGGRDSLALECAKEIDKSTAVACPLPVGSCSIHYPLTLHCSTPNHSSLPRIAYIMTFGKTPSSQTNNISMA
jgi:ectoine hydroxylase-related dioxygenase (phytanoyl-CoA dioxygenase family)